MLEAYPYLWYSLTLVAALAVPLGFLKAHRWDVLKSGLLAMPFALTSLAYVPSYWRPVRIAAVLDTGPEDLLVALGMGCWIWIFAFARTGGPEDMPRRPGAPRRYLVIGTLGIAVPVIAASLTEWNLIGWWFIGGILTVGGWLLVRHPGLWSQALHGSLGFGILHWAGLAAMVALWPSSLLQWNPAAMCGIKIGGAPIEEPLWALATGFAWPLFLWEVLGAPTPVPVLVRSRLGWAGRGWRHFRRALAGR